MDVLITSLCFTASFTVFAVCHRGLGVKVLDYYYIRTGMQNFLGLIFNCSAKQLAMLEKPSIQIYQIPKPPNECQK